MPVNRFLMPIVVIVTLLGFVFGSQALGVWATSGRETVNLEQIKPADVKGWMTLQQIIDGVPISQAELYALVNIPADVPPSTALKDMEPLVPDFSVTGLRDALTAWQGSSGSTLATAPAGMQAATPTSVPTQVATPAPSRTPGAGTGSTTGTHTGATPTPLPAGQILPANQIKGRMTLREVSTQCAVSPDALLAALKQPGSTNPDTAIKDFISAGKISDVTTVQQAVAGLQAR